MDLESIAAFSSVVIALCALALTFWQACIARRHNKLSVQPILTTWIHSDVSSNEYIIELLNKGVGPALIKDFKVFVDSHEIMGEGYEPIEKALKLVFPQYSYVSRQSFLSAGYSMVANETRALVSIKFYGTNFPVPEEIAHAIRRVRLTVNYASVYGELFVFGGD